MASDEQNRQGGRTNEQGQSNVGRPGTQPGQSGQPNFGKPATSGAPSGQPSNVNRPTIPTPSGAGQQVQQEARFYVNDKPLTTFLEKRAIVRDIIKVAGFDENCTVYRLSSKVDTQGTQIQVNATIEASRAEPVYLRCEPMNESSEEHSDDSSGEPERPVGLSDLQNQQAGAKTGGGTGGGSNPTRPGGGTPGSNPGTNPGRRNP